VTQTLAAWNQASETDALNAMLACCGAHRWAAALAALRPIANEDELRAAADRAWSTMQESDWLEAFACHPRIGERKAAQDQHAAWSRQEQSSLSSALESVLEQLATGNAQYEDRFGFTYIVCATGKSASEMLEILNSRLNSSREAELRTAAEQQRQITQIRIGKWLNP
jgi:OHCU decarboxylase